MEICESILDRIQGEYVELRHVISEYCDLRIPGGKAQRGDKEGFSIRVADKGRFKVAFSPRLNCIEDLVRCAEWRRLSGYAPPNPVHHYEEKPVPLELPVESVKNAIRTHAPQQGEARLESLTVYEHILTNLGTDVCHGTSKLFVRLFFTPFKDLTLIYSFGCPGEDVTRSIENLEELSPCGHVRCKTISSGQYNVVLSSQVTGMIFHEIAHLLEGSLPRIPELPSFISVSDHPEAERVGGYAFDSEGCRSSSTILIKKGEVSQCLASVFEPGNIPPTGNGRASSFDVQPIPRQSNLEVSTCEGCSEEELFEMVNNGVYIAQVGEGTSYTGGVTYFTKTVSYQIERGECIRSLHGVSFGGNLTDIVNRIQCMSDTPRVDPMVCWKGDQRLFVTTKAPCSLITGIPLHNSSRSP